MRVRWLFIGCALFAAEKMPVPQLLEMAKRQPDSKEFRTGIVDSLGAANVQKGIAVIGQGSLAIDQDSPVPTTQLSGGNLWV